MTPADLEPARGKPAPSAKSLRKAGAQSLECKRKVPPSADPPPQPNKKKKKTRLSLADTNKKPPPLEQAAETNKPLPLEHAAMTNNKPLPLEHAWTPGDEVQILEAMAAHRRAEQGKRPGTRELFATLHGRLDSKGFGRKELGRKVRSLKRRHDDDAIKGVVPAEGHECRLDNLSKNVWGTDPEPKTFDEMRKMYPCLAHEAVHIIREPVVLERLLMGIDTRKAYALNAKINDFREELTQAITESAKMQNIQVPKGWQCPHNKLPPAKSGAENQSLLYLDHLNKVLGARDVAQKQLAVAQEQLARMHRELVKLKQDIVASGPLKDIRCESAESAPQSVVAENHFSHNVKKMKIPAQEKLTCANDKEVTSKHRPSKNLSGKVILAPKRVHLAGKEKIHAESQILHGVQADERKVAGRANQILLHNLNVEGGKRVILHSCVRPHLAVAKATLQTCSPSTIVGDKELGPGCCQVLVNEVLDEKALLIRPFGTMNTVGDTLGCSIAWTRANTRYDATAGMVAPNQTSPGQDLLRVS